jgi:hypothetical protein
MHTGWVIVYADGRVIQEREVGGLHMWFFPPKLFERRLTAAGLEGVRSGAVDPKALLTETGLPSEPLPSPPADTWADAEFKPYEATRYAVCPWANPTRALNRLPAPARALLRGKERTYANIDLIVRQDYGPHPQSPAQCFEVSADDARALPGILIDAETTSTQPGGVPGAIHLPVNEVGDQVEMIMTLEPILPHGEWIIDLGG